MMLDQAVWPGTEIARWDVFANLAAEAAARTNPPRTILFRGQPRAWKLRSTLMRTLSDKTTPEIALRAERSALEHFKSQAHMHYPTYTPSFGSDGPSLSDWWSLMQHHGAPTRILDWTSSPYVAAYFAAEKDPEHPGVILVIDGEAANADFSRTYGNNKVTDEMFFDPDAKPILKVFTPLYKTPRLVAQGGYFTASTRPLDLHDELLQRSGAIIRRWIIPPPLKPVVRQQLWTMNVTANSLFPGLDGLGRSTAEVIRLAEPNI